MSEAVSSFTPEAVVERLRHEGLRITPARRSIIDVLFDATAPLSLQEIQDLAAARGGHSDYATVFRLIAALEKLHVVHKVNLQRSCSYYELHDPSRHYDHLVCVSCGKVVLIDAPCLLGAAEEAISKRYGFKELTHSLEFFGYCPECAA